MSKPEPHSPSMRERARVAYPALSWVCRDPGRLIAFGLGSGLIRPASGTWGTVLAWAIWIVAAPTASNAAIAGFLVLAFLYGCWACDRVGQALQAPDHVGMVWDEMVAFWLVLWLTPAGWLAQTVAFVLFRFFDIVKPPPIKFFDARLKGGFGVMWDDLLAALYAFLVMRLLMLAGVIG